MTCHVAHAQAATRFCPDCGTRLREDITRVRTVYDLVALAERLKVRPDWHEPDEQGVTAKVFGQSFDNAGFWPYDPNQPDDRCQGSLDSECLEMYVELYQAGHPIAQVNLATLFAMACRTYSV